MSCCAHTWLDIYLIHIICDLNYLSPLFCSLSIFNFFHPSSFSRYPLSLIFFFCELRVKTRWKKKEENEIFDAIEWGHSHKCRSWIWDSWFRRRIVTWVSQCRLSENGTISYVAKMTRTKLLAILDVLCQKKGSSRTKEKEGTEQRLTRLYSVGTEWRVSCWQYIFIFDVASEERMSLSVSCDVSYEVLVLLNMRMC